LKRVLGAPIAFFNATPIGRILNRFSKDVDNTDEVLPDVLFQALLYSAVVISIFGLITAFLPWFAVALVIKFPSFSFLSLNQLFI
jgi:ABC-type multidrug transport system fused ATPase/permease subunit